jgi:hypothetical protein
MWERAMPATVARMASSHKQHPKTALGMTCRDPGYRRESSCLLTYHHDLTVDPWSTRMNPARTLRSLAALATLTATVALAQDPVRPLQDLVGARGSSGEAELQQRGYTWVRTEKSGDSSWTYWREERSGRCVTVRTAEGRYQSLVYAPDADCRGGAAQAASAETGGMEADKAVPDRFDSVCGVIVAGKQHRYRCKVADFYRGERKVRTVLRYPDQTIKLVWKSGNTVELRFEGMNPQSARFASSEGETNFQFEDKTYFYISNKDAARMEVEHFQD